jgi:hypothetical protein
MCVAPKHCSKKQCDPYLIAAIVEYTAAIPDAKAKPAAAFHSAYFANKFVVIWVAVTAVNIPVFFLCK